MGLITIASLTPEHLDDAVEIMKKAYRFFDYPISIVAHEKLFGESPHKTPWAIGAFRDKTLVGVASGAGVYVRILAVHPREQGRGIGSFLLDEIEKFLSRVYSHICIAAEPGNYLVPGVDCRDAHSMRVFFQNGFTKRKHFNQNIAIDVSSVDFFQKRADTYLEQVYEDGYRAGPNEVSIVDEIEEYLRKEEKVGRKKFQATLFEARRGMLFTARRRQITAAFASYNANNRGLWWFGPMQTMLNHREQGLGEALLFLALEDIANRVNILEKPMVDIAWVGPVEFYTNLIPEKYIKHIRWFTVFEKRL